MAKTKKRKSTKKQQNQLAKLEWSKLILWSIILTSVLIVIFAFVYAHKQNKSDGGIDSFRAQPFNRVRPLISPRVIPSGINPTQIKNVYNLGGAGNGSGTVAIVDAYDSTGIESYLSTFDKQFGLSTCTTSNGCFEKHKMVSRISTSRDWAIEEALDVEWAHAIAPNAKILLVEARSNSGTDLLNAVDYARGRSDVVAVSMSWGGNEFSSEASYENHFISSFGATFFASSGDGGTGTSWPAVSANIVGVGGTTVHLSGGSLSSETAWSGSGGGISQYINEPSYQTTFGTPLAGGKRAVPDVSYDADPASGFPVYSGRWYQVGGTSAGAPQWAALRSISSNITLSNLYQDATSHYNSNFRDITSGTNGSCGTICTAQSGFDYVTGLGSPLGVGF